MPTDFKELLNKLNKKIKDTETELNKKNYFMESNSDHLEWTKLSGKWRIVLDGKAFADQDWQTKLKFASEIPALVSACEATMSALFADSMSIIESTEVRK